MRCPQCGKEHELLDPTFLRPDVVAQMEAAARQARVYETDDVCVVNAAEPGGPPRSFLRTILPVRLTDREDFIRWGIWVEVAEAQLRRVWDLWDSPTQSEEPPFRAALANAVTGYPDTTGLEVQVQLSGPTTRPRASVDRDSEHPFAAECARGVSTHRAMEWLAGQISSE